MPYTQIDDLMIGVGLGRNSKHTLCTRTKGILAQKLLFSLHLILLAELVWLVSKIFRPSTSW